MRVSQRPLQVGDYAEVMGNKVKVGTHNLTIEVGPTALTATPIANLNAAIKPFGLRVQVYWRNKDLGFTPETGSICLFGKGQTPQPLVPGGVVTVAINAPLTGAAGTVSINAPVPTPKVSTAIPAPAPITAPVTQAEYDEAMAPALAAQDDLVDPEDEETETVTEADMANSHRYRPNDDMLDQWDASERGVAAGHLPKVFLFAGPAGSGKTDGAAYLAARSGLDYLKVDAASIMDASDWFGYRDAVIDERTGATKTVYIPSDFALHLQREGMTYIDEVTRTKHRNVTLPIVDGTRRVLNPLTGTILQVHPKHRIVFGGNFGLAFAETFAVDIALLSRCLLIDFDYLTEADESDVLVEATGIAKHQADALARFAAAWRAQAKLMAQNGNADLDPVATRQLITAASQIAFGADIDKTAQAAFFRLVSDEGGPNGLRQKVISIWTGIRPLFDNAEDVADADAPDFQ